MGHTARYLKALPVVLLLAPLAQSLACDVAVLKGDATADGSVILVGLYEWQPTPGEPYPIMHVDRKQYEPGATVKLSFRTIPQVRQTWAYNYVHSRFRTEGKAKDFDLAVPSAAHAIIAHLREDVPQTLRAKAWIATRTPHANNLFLPMYAASKVGLPSELASPGCEYWFAKRANLSDKARAAFENWADARATDLEKRVKQDLGEGRRRNAQQRIQDYHQRIVARALDVYRSKE